MTDELDQMKQAFEVRRSDDGITQNIAPIFHTLDNIKSADRADTAALISGAATGTHGHRPPASKNMGAFGPHGLSSTNDDPLPLRITVTYSLCDGQAFINSMYLFKILVQTDDWRLSSHQNKPQFSGCRT